MKEKINELIKLYEKEEINNGHYLDDYEIGYNHAIEMTIRDLKKLLEDEE